MTESISPRSYQTPELRYQPSLLSIPSAAHSISPDRTAPADVQRGPKPTWRKLWFFTAVSALVGSATAGVLHRAAHVSPSVHSGAPGFKVSKTGRELMWQKNQVTVHLDGSLAQLGSQANEAIIQAFGQWVGSDSKLPAVTFDAAKTSTRAARDGKNTVSYEPITAPGHEHDVAITITYANDTSGEIVEADVILNARYPMGVLTPKPRGAATTNPHDHDDPHDHGNPHEHDSPREHGSAQAGGDDEVGDCRNRYDLQNVTTHEAGHFFGLGEDTTERGSAMYLTIDECETHKRALSSTDIGAVAALYAAGPEPESAGAAGCSFYGGSVSSGAALASGLIFGFGLWRRRRAR